MPEVTLKLYLKVGDQSYKVARFVREHIKKLNRIGAKINITLLSDGETAKSYAELRKRKVNDLPALLTAKKVFVGFAQISTYLQQNMNAAEHTAVSARISGDIYEDYLARGMMPDKDEKEENPTADFQRQMSEMRARRGESRQPTAPQAPEPAEPADNVPPPASVQSSSRKPTEDEMDREMLAALIGQSDYRDQF